MGKIRAAKKILDEMAKRKYEKEWDDALKRPDIEVEIVKRAMRNIHDEAIRFATKRDYEEGEIKSGVIIIPRGLVVLALYDDQGQIVDMGLVPGQLALDLIDEIEFAYGLKHMGAEHDT